MTTSRILWLTSKNGMPQATKAVILKALRARGVEPSAVFFDTLHVKVPNLYDYEKNRCPPELICRAVKHALAQEIAAMKPSVIACSDEATLRAILEKPYSLSLVRGSVYHFQEIPFLVFDEIKSIWADSFQKQGGKSPQKVMRHGRWVFGMDLSKLMRYAKGRTNYEPPFNLTICESLHEVSWHCEKAKQATLVSTDTETQNGIITVVSFTYDFKNKLYTFCVPFFDPFKHGNAYWNTLEDEVEVRRCIADLLASPVYKCMQNGMYDNAYFLESGMAPVGYYFDTLNMMHALWCEIPKKLHNITSYFVDNYVYWKDERKGEEEDKHGKTQEELKRYWHYNGLDTYYTWLCCRELVKLVIKVPWALKNYNSTIHLSSGPCFAASLRGLKVHKKRHEQIMRENIEKAETGHASIKQLVGEEEFNPRSTRDVAWFLYDFLKMKPTRLQLARGSKYGLRATNENILKLIKEQGNYLANHFINKLLEAKQSAGIVSKYGNTHKLCRNGRFLSWLNPCATTTSRFNSGKGQHWTGTNAQNIPPNLREFFVADDNYIFAEFDYSASDDRFIAYEAEDPIKIDVVEDKTKDPHCRHASHFFSKPYEEIYRGWKNEEAWIVDSIVGIRQNTKRVTHGRNYGEEAATMYTVMGRDAVIATAIELGYKNAGSFMDKQLIAVCQQLIDMYDHPIKGMYKRLRAWRKEICEKASKNGNTATASFGFTRRFLGNLLEDNKAQRELAAFYGQAGTAGNINRALREIWYSGIDDGEHCLFLLQVHDSLLFAIRKDSISHDIERIKNVMEKKTTIHGREMCVPVEAKVGLTWSKKMLAYTPLVTYEEILKFEEKTFGKKYGKEEKTIPENKNDDDTWVDFMSQMNEKIKPNSRRGGEVKIA